MSYPRQINVGRSRGPERGVRLPEDPLANLYAAVTAARLELEIEQVWIQETLDKAAIVEEPIRYIHPGASDWLVARMMAEGQVVPLNLDATTRSDWAELVDLSR